MAVTDAQLISNYLAGDERAFEELYSRYRKQVYSYLNRMLPGQASTVDDLYQKTWIKVIDNLAKYRDENRFIAYLLRIARNQAIDHIRRRKYEIPVEPEHVERSGQLAHPGAGVEKREIITAIADAVERLPLEQREVFIMRRQDVPFKEIAEVQGVSINTVLGRMRYAMENLRSSLVRAGVTA
jgi:RNA polymerase sigma-70 factor (ECF subfamily)